MGLGKFVFAEQRRRKMAGFILFQDGHRNRSIHPARVYLYGEVKGPCDGENRVGYLWRPFFPENFSYERKESIRDRLRTAHGAVPQLLGLELRLKIKECELTKVRPISNWEGNEGNGRLYFSDSALTAT